MKHVLKWSYLNYKNKHPGLQPNNYTHRSFFLISSYFLLISCVSAFLCDRCLMARCTCVWETAGFSAAAATSADSCSWLIRSRLWAALVYHVWRLLFHAACMCANQRQNALPGEKNELYMIVWGRGTITLAMTLLWFSYSFALLNTGTLFS